jgi:deoxyribonuclease IV
MKFGAHMSTSGGHWKALQRGASIGCEIIQIFVKNNMQWLGKQPAIVDVEKFRADREIGKFSVVFGHTGYLINLGAAPGPNRDKSLESLILEIEIATSLGLPFLVMHPGAHLGLGEAKGMQQTVAGLNRVFKATPKSKVRIALENTAGQGSCFGNRIEHLAAIYDAIDDPKRLGVCLDTAHLFAAGYDIRSPKIWSETLKQIDKLIGWKQVVAFHLNDSKTDLGSRVDRHEHIGKGKIGKQGFRHIVNDPRVRELPGCLETPKSDDLHEDVENLAFLRSLLSS